MLLVPEGIRELQTESRLSEHPVDSGKVICNCMPYVRE